MKKERKTGAPLDGFAHRKRPVPLSFFSNSLLFSSLPLSLSSKSATSLLTVFSLRTPCLASSSLASPGRPEIRHTETAALESSLATPAWCVQPAHSPPGRASPTV